VISDTNTAHARSFKIITNILKSMQGAALENPIVDQRANLAILQECRDTETVKVLINEYEADRGELKDPYKPFEHEILPEEGAAKIVKGI